MKPPSSGFRSNGHSAGRLGRDHPHVLLGEQNLERVVVETGSDDDFGEHLAERLRHRRRHGSVDGDDPTEGADRVAGVGLHVGVGDRVGRVGADRHAARVGVFDDDTCRVVESMHQPPCGLGVVEVEVAQRLAPVLGHGVPPTRRAGEAVAGALLVRILAVAQDLGPFQRSVQSTRQRFGVGLGGVEPRDDRGVVGSGVGERITRQAAAGRQRDLAVFADLGQHGRVVGRVDQDRHMGVVLGRCPHHRRPADVDQLDPRLAGERIQIADHQRDRLDPVLGHVGLMLGLGGVGQQARRAPSDAV